MKKTTLLRILWILPVTLLGCTRLSEVDDVDPQAEKNHKKMWRLPVASGLKTIPSDIAGFFLEGEEIRKYRLWNGCYTFFGQADSGSSISWSFSLALSKSYGEFDTTIAVADIPSAFKAGKDNFVRFGITQFRSENISNWVYLSGKYRVVSKFN